MIDTLIAVLNHGGAAVILISIFGVSMAQFALSQERYEKKLSGEIESPDDLIWWQDLQELGFEAHLRDGHTYRSSGRMGDVGWRRMIGNQATDIVTGKELTTALNDHLRDIRDGVVDDLHAHQLVDWSPLDKAYQLKLLNDSVWQWNAKSEGLSNAWHRISSPLYLVFEDLTSVYAALDGHLKIIRDRQKRAQEVRNATRDGYQLSELEMGGSGGSSDLKVFLSHRCSRCGVGVAKLGGGICASCDAILGHVGPRV
jgi:hypothetical protein